VKYAFIQTERTHYPIEVLCRVLDVSRSGYFAYVVRKTAVKSDPDAAVREALRAIHRDSRQTYGRPRLVPALRARGHAVGHKRVRRLMREENVVGACKGRRFTPATTDSTHRRPVAANVLDRRFSPHAPITAWVSDITYIPTREGWLYLAVVIALCTRQVLGYSLSASMQDDLVQSAFRNAYRAQPIDRGAIFHSDRGSQYASADFIATIEPLGFVPSMSRKGNCWDNAVAESFFATLKTEEVREPYLTKAQAHVRIADYIHGFYNPIRLHSALGFLSPNQFSKLLQEGQSP
jgi:transposase InsO family protein